MGTEFDDLTHAIAIVGIACRVPGADDKRAFWQLLEEGRDAISRFSSEDLLRAGCEPDLVAQPTYVRARGVLEEADGFDAAFFGYAPAEAAILDPQQRVFLETCWHALEDASFDPKRFEGRVGVFAGSGLSSHSANVIGNAALIEQIGVFPAMLAVDKDYVATRVSYDLDLTGPSFAVQTACSTSLVAVHLSVEQLLSGGCDVAIAGGVSITGPQTAGNMYFEGGPFSPTGRCAAFSADADGMVDGSGSGAVVLKRWVDAVADGDFIYAVIKGSAINNDGSEKIGFTAPSQLGQQRVILDALAMAGIDAGQIGLVEAHGTGTLLGDPIEVAALSSAFSSYTDRLGYCALGSAKSNIGHLGVAAGVIGLIKAALSLHHRVIPKTLHAARPNPAIAIESSPFYLPQNTSPWPEQPHGRYAAVSSFGLGGTNAHVILAEAPEVSPATQAESSSSILPLSARSAESLRRLVDAVAEQLEAPGSVPVGALATTLQDGRTEQPYRAAVVASDAREAAWKLRAANRRSTVSSAPACNTPDVGFLFSGAGGSHARMAADLYAEAPLFRSEIDSLLRSGQGYGLDLASFLNLDASIPTEQVDLDVVPTLLGTFCVQVAVSRCLIAHGVKPRFLLGHSVGEYAAATVAGLWDDETALRIVLRRSELMQRLSAGRIYAVAASAQRIEPLLPATVSIATVNTSYDCTIAGPVPDLEEARLIIEANGLEVRPIRLSATSHCALVDEVLPEFAAEFDQVKFFGTKVPIISGRLGRLIGPQELGDRSYWVDHFRDRVRFDEALDSTMGLNAVLVDVGPSRVVGACAEMQSDAARVVYASNHARSETHGIAAINEALAHLWMLGVPIDWKQTRQGRSWSKVKAPLYPFVRQKFPWLPSAGSKLKTGKVQRLSSEQWLYAPCWRPTARVAIQPETFAGLPVLLVGRRSAFMTEIESRLLALNAIVFHAPHIDGGPIAAGEAANIDSAATFAALKSVIGDRLAVIHMGGIGDERSDEIGSGFGELIRIARGLGEAGRQINVLAVTSCAAAVSPSEPIMPARTMIAGPVTCITQECPSIFCTHLDVEPDDPHAPEAILEEMCRNDRLGTASVRCGQRFELNYTEVNSRPDASIVKDNIILVTGGLGHVGLELADAMIKRGAAGVALLTRSPLPPRDQWPKICRSGEGELKRRIDRLQCILDAGGKVEVVVGDVRCPNELGSAIKEAERKLGGTITGVIHCAAIVGETAVATIDEITDEHCDAQFAAKVEGARVLADVLGSRPLNFCVLCSSLSAILGGLGYSAYAASNIYLDSLAIQLRRQRPQQNWLSISWELWASDKPRKLAATLEGLPMSADEGVEAFFRAISAKAGPHVAVSTGDLAARRAQWVHRSRNPAEAAEPTEAQKHPRPTLSTPYVAPADELEALIAWVWSEAFAIDQIGRYDSFFDLGGHSLLAVRINSALRDILRIQFPLRAMFDAPTVAQAATILRELAQEIELDVDSIAIVINEVRGAAGPAPLTVETT